MKKPSFTYNLGDDRNVGPKDIQVDLVDRDAVKVDVAFCQNAPQE